MGSRKDLTGQRFGKLIVLSPTDKRMDSGSVVWKCKCDCGKFAEVSSRQMIRGKVRSCGWLSSPPVQGLHRNAFRKTDRTRICGNRQAAWKNRNRKFLEVPVRLRQRSSSQSDRIAKRRNEKLWMPEQTSSTGLCWKTVWKAGSTEVCRQMGRITPLAVYLRLWK